jgi:proteasome lid subunit RPN8/RPN11
VVVSVKKRALLSALQGARETHPNEFIAFFSSDGGQELVDLIIPPLAQSNGCSASYVPWFLPVASGGEASFHSHPSHSNKPSKADLLQFGKSRKWHFIACYPYRVGDVAAYDSEGKRVPFTIT